ncbi:hypothetical protein RB195_000912 [Necator americanus]|uniref:Reverse transcriptase domain-containing protein n=1 Tax=Necator americanus TaxID=51031 RepID=A0ABR1DCD7_NECAM
MKSIVVGRLVLVPSSVFQLRAAVVAANPTSYLRAAVALGRRAAVVARLLLGRFNHATKNLRRLPEAMGIVLVRAMWQKCEGCRLEDGAGQTLDVSAGIVKMKSNKASGPEDIPTDVLKLLGDLGPKRLLCHTMKVFERVLEAPLGKIVSVSLNQCSTIDAIYAVRILLENHREMNRGVHLAFPDLEKAFDRVQHELLCP